MRGWGTVRKHPKGWLAEIYIGGRQRRKLCPSEKLANKALDGFRALKVETETSGRPLSSSPDITYGQISKEVLSSIRARRIYTDKTQRTQDWQVARLLEKWQNHRIRLTRPGHIEAWTRDLTAAGSSVSTVRHLLDMMSHFHRYAVRQEYLGALPCVVHRPGLDTKSTRDGYPPEEIDRLAKAAWADYDLRTAAVILTGARAGLRPSELVQLMGEDVSLERDYLRVEHRGADAGTKSKRGRTVPILDDDLRQALDRLPRARGKRLFGVLTYGGVVWLVHRAWHEAFGRPPELHRLRHTYGTVEAARGVPLPLLAKRMGHETILTTMRYVHLDDPALTGGIKSGTLLPPKPAVSHPPKPRTSHHKKKRAMPK